MIHSEENEGFDISKFFHFATDAFCFGILIILFACILSGVIPFKPAKPTKPNQTQIQDKCPSNTFDPIKLTGAIGSVQIDSVTTDKLDFPMYSDLLGGKPKGWGLKK